MEKSVGVRELRDGLTRYLGRVRRGDRLVITDRGQPVALLLPYRRGKSTSRAERLAALFASGQIIPAQRRFMKRPPLIRTRGRSMAELVAEDRR
jgi:prevent-host-death family protein